jgi:hypothetical protein
MFGATSLRTWRKHAQLNRSRAPDTGQIVAAMSSRVAKDMRLRAMTAAFEINHDYLARVSTATVFE